MTSLRLQKTRFKNAANFFHSSMNHTAIDFDQTSLELNGDVLDEGLRNWFKKKIVSWHHCKEPEKKTIMDVGY